MCIRTLRFKLYCICLTTLKLYFQFYNIRNWKVHQFSKSKVDMEAITRREPIKISFIVSVGFEIEEQCKRNHQKNKKACTLEYWQNKNHSELVILLLMGVSFNVWWFQLLVHNYNYIVDNAWRVHFIFVVPTIWSKLIYTWICFHQHTYWKVFVALVWPTQHLILFFYYY